MNQEKYLYRITQLLSRFKEQVKILSSNGEFSINIHAENILIKILNLLFECDLENTNYSESKTYPSIDLRDRKGKIAFQITSTANLEKVRNTIEKFIKHNIYKDFNELYIYIITDKQTTYNQDKINEATKGLFKFSKTQILDRSDLYKKLNEKNDLSIIKKVHDLLEEQFSDATVFNKWNLYCKGLEQYDEYLKNKFQYIDIKGFSPKINNRQVKISLNNIYVPLQLISENVVDLISKNEILESKQKKEIFIPENLLNEKNKIAILGDPGSGKSTLLKFLVFSICSNRNENAIFSDIVPVYIRISDYERYYKSFQKPISEYIINHYEKKFESILVEGLENNKLALFFDGLDEINDVHIRHDIVTEINNFIALYPLNKIIVTSRKVGYSETRLSSHFGHFELMDFDLPQIKTFAKNWYSSIAENSDKNIEEANKKAEILIKSISRNKSVIRLARNPLLVTIIALIDYQGTTLPEKRVELYDIATSTFLENWVNQRRTARKITFDKSGLIEILAPIAFYIHTNYSDGLIMEDEFKKLLSKSYTDIYPFTSKKEAQKDVNDIIDFIREDAGFIFEKGRNKNAIALFGFIHLTFQEYFASIEFATKWKEGYFKDNLGDYIFNSNWHEVLMLAASQFRLSDHPRVGRNKASEFIEKILSVNDEFPEIMRPLLIVFKALIDEVEIQPALFEKIINTVFKEILSYPEEQDNNYKSIKVGQFQHLIGELIKTRNYGRFLLSSIIPIIKLKEDNNLTRNLLFILMDSSDNILVKNELIELIKIKDEKINEIIFSYNTVWPVAEIVTTDEFKNEILEFVNSDYFTNKFKRLPTQFILSFVPEERYIFQDNITSSNTSIATNIINAIKLIKSRKIQQELANEVLSSVSWGGIKNIIDYQAKLRLELPYLNTKKVDMFVRQENMELKENYEERLIATFNKALVLKGIDSNYIEIKKGKLMKSISYPITDKSGLNKIFGEEFNEIIEFLNFIAPSLKNPEKHLTFSSINDIDLFFRYQRRLNWRNEISNQNEPIINLLLEKIVDKEICENYFHKILSFSRDFYYDRVKINDKYRTKNYIKKLKNSELASYQKLLLLSLVTVKENYQEFILPSIEIFRKTKDDSLKNMIYRILNRVLS